MSNFGHKNLDSGAVEIVDKSPKLLKQVSNL